jgi:hypothetical protein
MGRDENTGIRWEPLTEKQKKWVDTDGKRVLTEVERITIDCNTKHNDRARKFIKGRCTECDQTVKHDVAANHEIPRWEGGLRVVCELCWHMHSALQVYTLKDRNYFRDLNKAYEKMKRDDGSRGGFRDKAGM